MDLPKIHRIPCLEESMDLQAGLIPKGERFRESPGNFPGVHCLDKILIL